MFATVSCHNNAKGKKCWTDANCTKKAGGKCHTEPCGKYVCRWCEYPKAGKRSIYVKWYQEVDMKIWIWYFIYAWQENNMIIIVEHSEKPVFNKNTLSGSMLLVTENWLDYSKSL